MSKNRRTKSTGTAGSLIPTKGPIAAQHRPMPSSGGTKLYQLFYFCGAIHNCIRAWEKAEEEAKHLNININNNFNGNNININIVNRNLEARTDSHAHPITGGIEPKLSVDTLLKPQQKIPGKITEQAAITAKPGTFSHAQMPVRLLLARI